jgi:sortase A
MGPRPEPIGPRRSLRSAQRFDGGNRKRRRGARLRLSRRAWAWIAVSLAAAALALGFWIPAKAELAQYLLDRAWHEERESGAEAKPWPWADTSPFARLSIPQVDASWIVLAGASGRNLAFAPAHMDGSALPGEPGVTVIAGHRDTHFRALEQIQPGTGIVLEQPGGDKLVYIVDRIDIVDSSITQLRLDAPVPMLVLTTCYPFDAATAGGDLRFVVTATAVT